MNMQWLAVVYNFTGAPIAAQEAMTCMVRLMESGIEKKTHIHLMGAFTVKCLGLFLRCTNFWGYRFMMPQMVHCFHEVTTVGFPVKIPSWYRKIDLSIVIMTHSTRFWKALKDGIRKLGLKIADYVRLIGYIIKEENFDF